MLCFGVIRDYLPDGSDGKRTRLTLDDDARVLDAVESLGVPNRLVHAVLVNEEPAGLDRGLREGDEITLMPQFTGGV